MMTCQGPAQNAQRHHVTPNQETVKNQSGRSAVETEPSQQSIQGGPADSQARGRATDPILVRDKGMLDALTIGIIL